MKTFDLIIIGAGPGGYTLALRMAKIGWKVAIIEQDALGGTCLNWGCIPTKTLLSAAKGLYFLKNANLLGLQTSIPGFDWKKIQARKDGVVTQLRKGIERLLQNSGVTCFFGKATLLPQKTVRVSGAEVIDLKGEKICLAIGSIPYQPHMFPKTDKDHFWTSSEAISTDFLPKNLLIIGGGVVGMELGQIFAEFGTKVTIVEMMPQILPGLDFSVAKRLLIVFKRLGIEFFLGQRIEEFSFKGRNVCVSICGETREYEKILFSMGRRPNLSVLENSTVHLNVLNNFILVNDNFETSEPGVFAVGDCISGPMLAHKASYDASILAKQWGGASVSANYQSIPYYVYTYPEIAWIGFSEEELQKREIPYKVGRFLFSANGKALANDEPEGQVKTLVSPDGKLLGTVIWGMDVSSLLAEASIVKSCDLSLEKFSSRVIHAHPTLSEAFLEAFENSHGNNIHG